MNPVGADQGANSLISAIVHPIAVLWVLNIFNSLFSCSDSKKKDMIIGKVSSTPKNAYLRCDGKGFNSSLGGLSSEGNTLSSIGSNGSNLGAHPFASNISCVQLWSVETPTQMWSPPHPNLGLLDKT